MTGINRTIEAWADIVQEHWRYKLNKLNVGQTGSLYDSHKKNVFSVNGTPQKVRFTFKDYGIYVNYGVGREFSRGNKGDIGFKPKRKEKRWFSGVIFRETHILSRILAKEYGQEGAAIIVDKIRNQSAGGARNLVSSKTSRMTKSEF